MGFADPRRAEDQDVGPLLEPGVAAGKRHDVGLGKHRHLGEREAGERLGEVELGLVPMALDAPLVALGEFVLGKAPRKRDAGHPSLSARSANSGHKRPIVGRRSSVRHQRGARRLGRGGVHAATPVAGGTGQQGVIALAGGSNTVTCGS